MVVNAMKEVDQHQVFCYLPDALVQLMKACVLHNNIAKSLSFVSTSILASRELTKVKAVNDRCEGSDCENCEESSFHKKMPRLGTIDKNGDKSTKMDHR